MNRQSADRELILPCQRVTIHKYIYLCLHKKSTMNESKFEQLTEPEKLELFKEFVRAKQEYDEAWHRYYELKKRLSIT